MAVGAQVEGRGVRGPRAQEIAHGGRWVEEFELVLLSHRAEPGLDA